jgi:histidine triad (HIT) family protein
MGRTCEKPAQASLIMSYDTNNIFAKILRGEIPCHKVYENADAIVFMDVMPQSPGHALILPKSASRNLLDADPAVLAKIIPLVQKVAVAAKSAFDADGVSIAQFNETAGGQTVFHLHFHVIPRYEGKPLNTHARNMEDNAVLAANAEKLKAALAA